MMISRAAALTNPTMTGWLSRFTTPPMFDNRNSHRIMPDCRHSRVVMPR
jgi:hypothetical protein